MNITDKTSDVLIDLYKANKEGHNIWYARQYKDGDTISQEMFLCSISDINDFLNQIKSYNYFDKFKVDDVRAMYAVKEAIKRGINVNQVYHFNYGDNLIQICVE